MFQDTSDQLFNFVPCTSQKRPSSEKRLNLGLKRRAESSTVYSFIKKPHRDGAKKVIKIEIYDSEKINTGEEMCKCNAEICAQYVVKSTLLDNVYEATRNLIEKIESEITSDTCNGYTML